MQVWIRSRKFSKNPPILLLQCADGDGTAGSTGPGNYEVITFPEPGVCPLHVSLRCPCADGTSCSDLIVSDVNMLGQNGIDFVEQLINKGCRQRHFALMSGAFRMPIGSGPRSWVAYCSTSRWIWML